MSKYLIELYTFVLTPYSGRCKMFRGFFDDHELSYSRTHYSYSRTHYIDWLVDKISEE